MKKTNCYILFLQADQHFLINNC